MRGRAAAIAKTLVPALGLSFLWPYFRASFLSFLTVFDVHPGPVVHAAYSTYVAVFALVCACAVFAAPQARRWLRARHAPLALGLCGSAGNGLLWLGAPAPLDTALCVAGCVGATCFFAGCLLGLSLAGGALASVGSDVATVSRVCFTLLMFLFALEAQRWTSAGTVRLLGLFLLLPEALSAFVHHIVVPPLLASTGMEPLAAASYAGVAIVLVLIVAIVVVLGNLLLRQVEPRAEEAAFPAASPVDATGAAPQAPSPDARGAALARIARDFGLTAREMQTASYVSQGYSLEKTAELLGISINTVRTHMRSVYGKLAIHSRQELIDLLDGRA